MRCALDKKPDDEYEPAREYYPGGDPWFLHPKRLLFWIHMLLLPVACGWAGLMFADNNAPGSGYNTFYLVYVISFYILLFVTASYDQQFRDYPNSHTYHVSKRLSRVLVIAYPVLWFTSLVSFAANFSFN